jgi:alanine dehydrogenase
VHYGVANLPALVPRTSTFALTNATLPFVLRLADAGAKAAVTADPVLARGVNVWRGAVTHPAVADSLGIAATPLAHRV